MSDTPSLGRHQFENKTRGALQFFEWELGWHDDLQKPTWLVEKLLELVETNDHVYFDGPDGTQLVFAGDDSQ